MSQAGIHYLARQKIIPDTTLHAVNMLHSPRMFTFLFKETH
jgi:hypothetical protein